MATSLPMPNNTCTPEKMQSSVLGVKIATCSSISTESACVSVPISAIPSMYNAFRRAAPACTPQACSYHRVATLTIQSCSQGMPDATGCQC
ncbi:hypothetical protein APX70_04814 [Pseudomonas syringae pv. maculicola]|uniref:Uncharacterized protein n=1 Tax=Pseudomonas syringae pv. maculicola TaxID=59511 RepID=A0A3M2TYP8_PSEYM|nr:hypothetical protein APX70_04814 [Pseudomonas syringae pv. maculicola]